MTVVVVAEKPSVARDIASVLGAKSRAEGYFHGNGWAVTWAIGHLVALAEPHEIDPAWKRWRLEALPMLPAEWPLVVLPKTKDQYAVVKKLLVAKETRGIVCATDAGREGELIFRYIYDAARANKPVRRLWISSLTPSAIAAGFRQLKDAEAYDRLGDAARARSRADWLVGMNLSRLYSMLHDGHLSVGRVQTPTLAMLVARELEIRNFVPEDYLEVVATFAPPDPAAAKDTQYDGTWIRPGAKEPEARRLPPDGELAKEIALRAKTGAARIASVDRESRRLPPPQLYDLTELQRHANRLYGMSAQKTLETAQSLYERYKLISYPRTDSRFLSKAVAETLPDVVRAITGRYPGLVAEGTGSRPLGARFVDDARVSDHHAILPTTTPAPEALPEPERRIYDLVCRRLLAAWHPDHVYAVTTVMTTITTGETVDHYKSQGTSVEVVGWRVLDVVTRRSDSTPSKRPGTPDKQDRPSDDATLPGGLAAGQERRVAAAAPVAKKTRPPPRFTDGTLLTAMETAGRHLAAEDGQTGTIAIAEMTRAMRDRGLGTPATRAAILETLLRREYAVRDGKMLCATDKGIALVEAVHPRVKSPTMTGEWEAKLARIERGEVELDAFTQEIERYVAEVVGLHDGPAAPRPSAAPLSRPPSTSLSAPRLANGGPALATRAERPPSAPRASRSGSPRELLRTVFGFADFRPLQEAVCTASAGGADVLLVMPTGAGKSLCYQLPGLARGGTTLVVSPLIALMEDQVAQLVRRGLRADRIHSGRSRLESRAICQAYLAGDLDFLFIAPERLRVPGFPEMLARRKPTLIAIDEAHCISQWGHDFRPDYRLLGDRLPILRPAPVIALTATATPDVQDDIAERLGLASPARFIHGFRRTNLGIEVVERAPSLREEVVVRLLGDEARRPAIVYAPTRAEADDLARALAKKLRAAAYHAGLDARRRDAVQAAFLDGELDIVVATIAFGMGIDKPDVRTVIHAALPGTLEGYYQEIGRAGRDGKPSRVVLLHSFVDTKMHEFFLERDYPAIDVLAKLEKAVPAKGIARDTLARKAKLDDSTFDKALEKLMIHGALKLGEEGAIVRGGADWARPYARQRSHRQEQLAKMQRFTEKARCRMLQLIEHFGDESDAIDGCGQCDVCAPATCIAQTFRKPSERERAAAKRVTDALEERDGRSVGQLHRDLFDPNELDRRALEHVLGALARAGVVELSDDTFDKDGKTIPFQRAWLAARRWGAACEDELAIVSDAPSGKTRARATARTKTGVKAKKGKKNRQYPFWRKAKKPRA